MNKGFLGFSRTLGACAALGFLFFWGAVPAAQAGPWGGPGWCGGWGGYRGGWGGPGWYGTGVPNGLGWTMFGLAAAGGVAATAAAYSAPVIYAPPVYEAPAPVYAAPAYAPVGYYQPPQTVVMEKKVSRPVDPPSNTLAKAESKLAGLGYYKGSVDGEYGPAIQQAIQQFQTDNGLPVSGRLDLKTLSSLGIAL